MRTDEFIAGVGELGGPTDRTDAERVTHLVLEDLGRRLQGGEPSDLDAFLRRVAGHRGEDVTADQARAHVQAVLSTLTRFLSEGEIQALRSQLPAGVGPPVEAAPSENR